MAKRGRSGRGALAAGAVLLAGGAGLAGSVPLRELRASAGSRSGAPQGEFPAPVERVLTARCVSCHAGPRGAAGLLLDGRASLLRGSAAGEVVIPFDPRRSLLLERVRPEAGDHPPGRAGLDPDEYAVLKEWVEAGAPDQDGREAFADGGPRLYVTNQADAVISVVDPARGLVVRTVDLVERGFSGGAKPHHVAVEPDGSHWYVSLIGDGRVLKLDRENRIVGRAEFEAPGLLALDPRSDRLLVGRSMAAVNPPERIGIVDRATMEIEEVDVFLPRPHAIALAPDGRRAWVASLAENRMAVVDPAAGEVVSLAPLPGAAPHVLVQFAVSPDGRWLAGAGELSGELLVFDLADPDAPRLAATLPLGDAPWHPVFTGDGRWLVIGRRDADAVAVIDVRSWSVSRMVEGRGISQPHGATLDPDGRRAWISNRNLDGAWEPRRPSEAGPEGTVVQVDPQTGDVGPVVEVERYPAGIATPARPRP